MPRVGCCNGSTCGMFVNTTQTAILHTYKDMKKHITLLFSALCMLALVSCDDKPRVTEDVVIPPPINGSVMMVNEGNFQSGNSSLTVLNFTNGELYQNVFESRNNRNLGDVFQSASVAYGKAYLVVNNSKKIEVVDPATYQSVGVINGLHSPRYMLAVNPNKAYVTEYYFNAVRIIDLNTNTIAGSVPLEGWMDEMALVNDKVYITNAKKEYVYVLNTANDQVEDSVKVTYGSVSIQVDAHQKVWVLCNGRADQGVRPALVCINPATNTVEKSFSLTMAETDVSRLRINKQKDQLYWLSRHVYTHGIEDASVSGTPFIRSVMSNFYGLGVDPRTNEVYVSDAKDYIQRSNISRYSKNGNLVGDFTAGLITGDFCFYYP
jgi:hypothetical protein